MQGEEAKAAAGSEGNANLFQLDGRVPLWKAIPFGLQHVLAMFVANMAPMLLIAGAAEPALEGNELAVLLQNAMFVAGIATLIQLYPVWRVGARLPVVMGVSFTFVSLLATAASRYGLPVVLGAVLIGGCFEGLMGLLLRRYWNEVIAPIVSAVVVTTIGASLFGVGARSFGGGYAPDFGSPANLALGGVTLGACLLWACFARGFLKQLSVLFGLVVGFIVAVCMRKVQLNGLLEGGWFAPPRLLPHAIRFRADVVIATCIIFLVSAAETMGDVSALTVKALGRPPENREISGALGCDGFASALSSLLGCMPVTSFSQNVGLAAMTKVVNRFTIMTGAACLVLAGFFPPLGKLLSLVPDAVLGGCTIMLFGSIMVTGIQMIGRCGFTQRNNVILALSLVISLGFTRSEVAPIWEHFPAFLRAVFAQNEVAIAFFVSTFLNLCLPQDMEVWQADKGK